METKTVVTSVSEDGQRKGYVLGPQEGEILSPVGVEIAFKALAGDTDGRFLFMEYVAPPNFPGPPPHWHRETMEVYYVLEGTITFQSGQEIVELRPGAVAYVPTGAVHSFANETDAPARFVGLAAPSGLEEYFFKLVDMIREEPTWPPEDPQKRKAIGALAREYDQYSPDTAPDNGRVIIRRPDEGQAVSLGGQTMIWKTVGQDTDGQVATLLYEGGAGVSGPPPHYHKETAEVGYVLEGSITFHLEERDVEAGPGSFFYIPPGLVHGWSSHGDKQVKFLGFALPAGIENYFLEMVELMEREPSWPPQDMNKIAALGRKYDQYMAKGPS